MVWLFPLGNRKRILLKGYAHFPIPSAMLVYFYQMQNTWNTETLGLNCKNIVVWLQGSLLYNEYIVYNVDQIKMRYALHVSFNPKRR